MQWGALFPGQGSQKVGMGRFLYDNFPSVQNLFEEASDTISTDMKKLCFEGPESDLAMTENTQPALLLTSVASYQALKEMAPFSPHAGAGHSVGEYAAAVASGVLQFSSGIQAVRQRGRAMQEAVPLGKGGMTAVMGLTDEQVEELCQWAVQESGLDPIQAANFNSPGQVVISGKKETLDWVQANIAQKKFNPEPSRLRLIPLKVSAPFHCSMMKPAEKVMESVLESIEFSSAHWAIVQNVTAKASKDAEIIRKNLVAQVSQAVRWTQCMKEMKSMGIQNYIEFGVGKVLSGLMKKIDGENTLTFSINSLEDLKNLEIKLCEGQ